MTHSSLACGFAGLGECRIFSWLLGTSRKAPGTLSVLQTNLEFQEGEGIRPSPSSWALTEGPALYPESTFHAHVADFSLPFKIKITG